MPYTGRGPTPFAPASSTPRQFNGTSHRIPYHSPNGGDHRGGWDHRGHDHDHGHDHHGHFGYGVYGWVGYPYWPWWGWGYPFLNGWWDSSDDYDIQTASNYAAAQYPEYAPNGYGEAKPGEPEPQYEPGPSSSPAPQPAPAASAPIPEAPLTLVFKDGRPNEQIHNYLLTSKTLSVLDRNHREIPVDQIDVSATERVNREAGVEFAVPHSGGK